LVKTVEAASGALEHVHLSQGTRWYGSPRSLQDSDQGGRSAAHAAEFLLRPAGLSRRIAERQALDVVGRASARGLRILDGRTDEPDSGDRCLCEHLQGIPAAAQLSGQARR